MQICIQNNDKRCLVLVRERMIVSTIFIFQTKTRVYLDAHTAVCTHITCSVSVLLCTINKMKTETWTMCTHTAQKIRCVSITVSSYCTWDTSMLILFGWTQSTGPVAHGFALFKSSSLSDIAMVFSSLVSHFISTKDQIFAPLRQIKRKINYTIKIYCQIIYLTSSEHGKM